MHLFVQFFKGVGRGSPEHFRVAVVHPFDPLMAIKRLDPCAHPLAQRALSVRVNLYARWLAHHSLRRIGQDFLLVSDAANIAQELRGATIPALLVSYADNCNTGDMRYDAGNCIIVTTGVADRIIDAPI